MRCVRTPIEAEVYKYEVGCGMEDGFELWSTVVTSSAINSESLIKIKREDGTIVCPYILHHRGRTYIKENDYLIAEDDGTRHVCGEEKIFSRYQKK